MEINCLSQFFTNCWYSVHACTRKWGRFASYTLCTMPRTVNMKITEKLEKACNGYDASSNVRFPLHFQFHVSYFCLSQILKWTENEHIFCTWPWSNPLFFQHVSLIMKILLILMAILTLAESTAHLEDEMIVPPAGILSAATLRYTNTVMIHNNKLRPSVADLHSILSSITSGLFAAMKNF